MVTQLAPSLDQLKHEVPERPRLAPGVRLAGQMQESAFVDPPWLVEREGVGYVQLPRPLYRIAELADGQHTLEEIARAVSTTEGRRLSADNVRYLIARQFIPNGIVLNGAGNGVAPARSPRSALAIARMKSMDARTLDGLTRVLQVLLWPPVLLVVLTTAALVEGWLYVVHGLGGPLHDVFYLPGYMVLAVMLIIGSAGFHELGHAAALRYAGGTPRSFGFGMYLMYPVFFTDVSDNYRLRRWARVRTDLGGFYFNLIVALAVFLLYVLTRQEALLVLILLINFEIIHQLLPLVRLDGYWTLVDLTGIPDFFSQMGAFVRSILPFARNSSGRRLPPLKWWGKAVFLGYIMVTIPALVFLLFLMLRSVPRVLATAWDSLGQQGQALQQAQAGGDLLGMAGALGQSVLLVLPVGGLLFALYHLGRSAATFLWRWGAPSTARRALSGAAGLAFAGLLCALWLPQIPFLGNRPSPIYQPDAFTPIGRDERFSITDVLTGRIVPRPPDAELPAWMPQPRVRAAVAWVLGRAEHQPGAGAPPPPPPPPSGAGSSGAPGSGSASSAGTGPSGAPSVALLSADRSAASSAQGAETAPGSDNTSGSDAAPGSGTASGSDAAPGSGIASGSGAAAGSSSGSGSGSAPGADVGASPGSAGGAAGGPAASPAGEPPPASGLTPAGGLPAAGVPGAADVTNVPAALDGGPVPPAGATGLPGAAVGAAPASVATAASNTTSGPAADVAGVATTAVPAAATAVPAAATAVPAAATAVPGALNPANAPVNTNPASGVVPSHIAPAHTNAPGAANPAQPLATAVPTAVTGAQNTLSSVAPAPAAITPPAAVDPLPAGGTVPGAASTPVAAVDPLPASGANPVPNPGSTPVPAVDPLPPGGTVPGAATTPAPAVDPQTAPGATTPGPAVDPQTAPGATTPGPAVDPLPAGGATTPAPAVDPLPAGGGATPVPAAQPPAPAAQPSAPPSGQAPPR